LWDEKTALFPNALYLSQVNLKAQDIAGALLSKRALNKKNPFSKNSCFK